jgi:hypothetical protein
MLLFLLPHFKPKSLFLWGSGGLCVCARLESERFSEKVRTSFFYAVWFLGKKRKKKKEKKKQLGRCAVCFGHFPPLPIQKIYSGDDIQPTLGVVTTTAAVGFVFQNEWIG